LPTLISNARGLAAQARRHERELDAVRRQVERVLVEEDVEHLLVAVAQRAQQDRDRELAATVDARVDAVLGVELESRARSRDTESRAR
jgi:hypothetical protein